jgi:hypothetical protein
MNSKKMHNFLKLPAVIQNKGLILMVLDLEGRIRSVQQKFGAWIISTFA